jgi:hypothetical protein
MLRDAGPAEDVSRAKRVAIETCRAILAGEVAPYDGARKIWWEAWVFPRHNPLGDALVPFIGEASQWEDNPEAREEIEGSIRQRAAQQLALWESPQDPT